MADEQEILSRLQALEHQVETLYSRLNMGMPGVREGEVTPEVQMLLQQNRKIEAVKLYREQTGVSLAEAAETIDRYEPID